MTDQASQTSKEPNLGLVDIMNATMAPSRRFPRPAPKLAIEDAPKNITTSKFGSEVPFTAGEDKILPAVGARHEGAIHKDMETADLQSITAELKTDINTKEREVEKLKDIAQKALEGTQRALEDTKKVSMEKDEYMRKLETLRNTNSQPDIKHAQLARDLDYYENKLKESNDKTEELDCENKRLNAIITKLEHSLGTADNRLYELENRGESVSEAKFTQVANNLEHKDQELNAVIEERDSALDQLGLAEQKIRQLMHDAQRTKANLDAQAAQAVRIEQLQHENANYRESLASARGELAALSDDLRYLFPHPEIPDVELEGERFRFVETGAKNLRTVIESLQIDVSRLKDENEVLERLLRDAREQAAPHMAAADVAGNGATMADELSHGRHYVRSMDAGDSDDEVQWAKVPPSTVHKDASRRFTDQLTDVQVFKITRSDLWTLFIILLVALHAASLVVSFAGWMSHDVVTWRSANSDTLDLFWTTEGYEGYDSFNTAAGRSVNWLQTSITAFSKI